MDIRCMEAYLKLLKPDHELPTIALQYYEVKLKFFRLNGTWIPLSDLYHFIDKHSKNVIYKKQFENVIYEIKQSVALYF